MTAASPESLRRAGRISHRSQTSPLVTSHLNSCPDGFEHEGSVMSKQIACLLTGLSLAMSSVGCCCLGGYGYGANRCNPCNNGCQPGGGQGYYPPATTMQTYDGSQTAFAPGISQTAAIPGAMVGAPIMASPGGYTTTVMVPANALPTY